MSAQLRLVRPRHENRSVPVRPPNDELRSREYCRLSLVVALITSLRDSQTVAVDQPISVAVSVSFEGGQ
jgi:hypothetical protein